MFKDKDYRESALVNVRLLELNHAPLKGSYDARHLAATHAYIFQDLPECQPGKIRDNTNGWWKLRKLEDESIQYRVDYLSSDVSQRIETTLKEFGGPHSLRGATAEHAASRMAQLYGDLDYAHGFQEGNSRTLREFTRNLASEAGYKLNWISTSVDAEQRNCLYIARDILVLERAYPILQSQSGSRPLNILESNASMTLTSLRSTGVSLEGILEKNLTPGLERAQEMRDRGQQGPREEQAEVRQGTLPNRLQDRVARLKRQFARDFNEDSREGNARSFGMDEDE